MRQWVRFPSWGNVSISNVVHARSLGVSSLTACGARISADVKPTLCAPHIGEVCMKCLRKPRVHDDLTYGTR